jgi:phytoene desaturase
MSKDKKNIGIIGAGIGGLATSLLLAAKGYDVHLYEKNNYVGGKISSIENNGFRFDTGASLLTMTNVLIDFFSEIGQNIDDFLKINKLNIITKYFYPDNSEIIAYQDFNEFAREIESKTIDKKTDLKKYFQYSEKIYDLTAELFIFKEFRNINNLFSKKGLKTLINVFKIDPFRTIHQANSSFFKDTKTIQLFDRYATYNGSNPYQAPATLNIIPFVEYKLGGYYLDGGMIELVNAFSSLIEKTNVNLHLNSNVEQIIVSGNYVDGIIVNGEFKKHDLIVSNSDVNFTFKQLLPNLSSSEAKRNTKNEVSSSALVFYWGIKDNFPELETYNIIFSENYEHEFFQIFKEKQVPNDPTIYIYISSKFNQNDAPNNSENWFVMINTPEHNEQNWDEIVIKTKEIILNKIEKTLNKNIRNLILNENILTPLDLLNKTNSYKGSIYGISSNSRSAAFMRQTNKSKSFKNLFFVGGSVHPGGGIPLVISSSRIVANLITKYYD